MHFAYLLNVVRRWQTPLRPGTERHADAFGATLEQIAAGPRRVRGCRQRVAAGSDAARTTARRTQRAGSSPVAGLLHGITGGGRPVHGRDLHGRRRQRAVRLRDGAERRRRGRRPRRLDALGMRASGSHSVSFEDVQLPAAALRGGFPSVTRLQYIERNLERRSVRRRGAAGESPKVPRPASSNCSLREPPADSTAPGGRRGGATSSTSRHAAHLFTRGASLSTRNYGSPSMQSGTRGPAQRHFSGPGQSAKLFIGDAGSGSSIALPP